MRVLLACGFLLLIGRLAPAAELEQHPRPRNWIIGPDGTLLREQLGFRGDQTEEQFVTSALEALDGAE